VTRESLFAKRKDGVTHMLVRYLLVGTQIWYLKSSISLGESSGVCVVEELASSRTSWFLAQIHAKIIVFTF